jgi:hypothetical protein
MTTPTLEERKTYWKWAYAAECFKDVKRTLEYTVQSPVPDEAIGRIFLAGIVATYAKPFTNCHGVGTLDRRIIPQEHLKIHNAILNLRHKAVAHFDALNYKADDPSFGNINQVLINKDKTQTYGYTILLLSHGFLLDLPICDLCSKLLTKAEYHTARFEKKFISGPELAPGDYLLNIDPLEKRAFVLKS